MNPPTGFNALGYGIFNLGPAPVAGGKIAFVSNRNGFIPPRGLTTPTFQLFVMDEDGANVTPIAPMTIGSALHPTPLRDGRLLFSSHAEPHGPVQRRHERRERGHLGGAGRRRLPVGSRPPKIRRPSSKASPMIVAAPAVSGRLSRQARRCSSDRKKFKVVQRDVARRPPVPPH